MVGGEIVVDVVAVAAIDGAFLQQRHADAHGHSTDELRARRARVEDGAGREHAEHTRHADLAGERVDAHLGELRAEPMTGEGSVGLDVLGGVCLASRPSPARSSAHALTTAEPQEAVPIDPPATGAVG